jgi:exosortase/archaeosortase family protein
MAQVVSSVLPPPKSWWLRLKSSWSKVQALRIQAHAVWVEMSATTRTVVQMSVLIGVVVIAYDYSLLTLWQLAGLNTPLAYISLVPVISLGLAALHRSPTKPEPAIHDRQTDYIIGLPLMMAAVLINYILPNKLSVMYWVWRIDLLTLPIFVAGAVAVIFGLRVLWRQRLAVAFLFLVWPYPYTSVLLRLLNAFTSATLFGLDHILKYVHVATPVSSLDNEVFSVTHAGHAFTLSVVSECSGVSSVVGFLLVGLAFAAIVQGPRILKAVWLLGGMLLLWLINLGRITFIFWAGQHYGESIAINVLHPFIGLVTFSMGVGIMILCIKPLGMRIGQLGDGPGAARNRTEPAVPSPKARHPLAVPKVYAAVVIVLVLGILLGVSNQNLRSYNLVEDVSGSSRVLSFIASPVVPVGWNSQYEATFSWAKPLFGEESTWNRYILHPVAGGDLQANTDVVADVIDTPDLQTFTAFGIEQCYEFHGYSLANVSQVSLGGGVTGQTLAYTSQQFGSWSIVYWILPVANGTSTYYERVVLYVQNHAGLIAPRTEDHTGTVTNISGNLNSGKSQQAVLLDNRDFLIAYAREMIRDEAIHSAPILAHHSALT